MKSKTNRIIISDDKIIELYNAGWSINDIVANYKTSVSRVRRVLQGNGINTANYRAASEFLKECIMETVAAGVSIRQIANIMDVSAHLVRQVLRQNQVNASDLRNIPLLFERSYAISADAWMQFLDLYHTGQKGFFKCAEQCAFSVNECVEAALRLNEKDCAVHKERLTAHILTLSDSGLSACSLGKQFGLSPAIVKQIFQSQG